MLSYQFIKRKYKLNDTNIADFFGYKNRISFITSSYKAEVEANIERTYDQFMSKGVKGAAEFIQSVSLKGSPGRQERYRGGLLEFLDTINFQEKKGKVRDPVNSPYSSKGKSYKPKK